MNYLWGGMILIGIIYGTLTGNIEAVSDAVLSSSKEAVTLCIAMLGVMALWTGIMEIAKDAGLIASISRKIQPIIHFLFPEIPERHEANTHITTNFIANLLGLGWAATPAGLKAMEELANLEEERRTETILFEEENARQYGAKTDALPHGGQNKFDWKTKQSGEGMKKMPDTEPQKINRQSGKKKNQRSLSVPAMPRGVASNEMCTFLILNISSLQLIPVNVIAYRAQYGSVNPTAIVGPGIVATAVSTGVAVMFCKVMDRRKRRA